MLAAPSIGPDGNIYAGTPWGLFAIDKKTGKHLWSVDINLKDYALRKVKIQSPPASVFAGETGSSNKRPSRTIWRNDEYDQWTSLIPLISTNGTIYLGAEKLYAINPGKDDRNGTKKWVLPTGGGSITAPLSISNNGMLFAASQTISLSLNSFTTAKIWSNPNGKYRALRSFLKGYGGTLFSTDASGISGRNANTGRYFYWNVNPFIEGTPGQPVPPNEQGRRPICSFNKSGTIGLPAMGPTGAIYVGSFGSWDRPPGEREYGWKTRPKVYAISETTGTVIWESAVGGSVVSSPSIGQDFTIYVGAANGRVYAIDHFTGKHKWVFQTGGPVLTTPAIGNNGVIYVGSNDGKLYALNPDGTKKWVWEYNNKEKPNRPGTNPTIGLSFDHCSEKSITSSPTIGPDGTIYFFANNGKLYAVKSGSTKAAISTWPMFGQNSRHTYSVWFPHVGDSRPPGIKKPWTYNTNKQSIDRIYIGKPYSIIKNVFGTPHYIEGRLYRYDGMAVAHISRHGNSSSPGGSVWFQFYRGFVEKVYVKEDSNLLPIPRVRATLWSIGNRPGRKNLSSLLYGKTPGAVYGLLGEPWDKTGRFENVGWLKYVLLDVADGNGIKNAVRIEIRRGKVSSVSAYQQGSR